jgi:predicted small secreted protein
MSRGKLSRLAGPIVALMVMMGTGFLVSACGTVAGAGQDVSAIGNTVTSGAVQTQRATHAP